MKGLIYKDFCIVLRTCKISLIIIEIGLFGMMAVVTLANTDAPVYMLPVVFNIIFGMAMELFALSHDEQSGWLRQGFTMPLHRLECYHARIAMHFLCTAAMAVMGIFIALISALAFGEFTLAIFGWLFSAAGIGILVSSLTGICINALCIRLGLAKTGMIFSISWILFSLGCTADAFRTCFETDAASILTLTIVAVIALIVTSVLYVMGRKWIKEKEL